MPAMQPATLFADRKTAALWKRITSETTAWEKEKQCLPKGAISYVLLDLFLLSFKKKKEV